MTEHPNAVLARRFIEAFRDGDTATVASMLADDVEWHEIGRHEPIRGLTALAARFADGAADYTITGTVHDVMANDEHVVVLTNAEADRGGRHLSYRTAEICHVKDGKMTARWAFSDYTQAIIDFFA